MTHPTPTHPSSPPPPPRVDHAHELENGEQRIEHEGRTLRVIPIELHDARCEVRVASRQGTTPEVLHCHFCGFCYPPPASRPALLDQHTTDIARVDLAAAWEQAWAEQERRQLNDARAWLLDTPCVQHKVKGCEWCHPMTDRQQAEASYGEPPSWVPVVYCGSPIDHKPHRWSDYGDPSQCPGVDDLAASPPEPGRLPRLGEVVRDAERTLAQALNILGRDYDPASAPVGPVWSGVELQSHVVMLRLATSDVARALKLLRSIADLPLPPVGSAVHVPAVAGYGTTPSAAGGESPARSGGPGTTVAVECCGGKSLNDGIAAVCGRRVTHYPHRLDREPGAL